MNMIKDGCYLAPEVEIVEVQIESSLLIISGGNESITNSGNSYDDDDFSE